MWLAARLARGCALCGLLGLLASAALLLPDAPWVRRLCRSSYSGGPILIPIPILTHRSLGTPCDICGIRLLPLRRLARPSAWGHMNYD